jgi:hypothetical protein
MVSFWLSGVEELTDIASGILSRPGGASQGLGTWREAQQATETLREEAQKFSAECAEQQKRPVGPILKGLPPSAQGWTVLLVPAVLP